MEKITNIKQQLAQLEEVKTRLDELAKEQKRIVDGLNRSKEKLHRIKTAYDAEVVPFARLLIELDACQTQISQCSRTLGVNNPSISIQQFFAYMRNFGEGDTGVFIHESIRPATLGSEVWSLVRKEITNGRK